MACLVGLLLAGAVPANAGPQSPTPPESAGAEPLSAESAEDFVAETVPEQLRQHHIPGAAVSVVSGGEQVFAEGYGVADRSSGRPVTAEETVFAPASVGKLLTATAVMQLVEAGTVDLDTDVNRYLDFEVDDTYPGRPITLRRLLTHTAGFAAHDRGTAAATVGDIRPLRTQLAEHLPDRIRPPGERSVYSNYGMGLAGYVVERQSGMAFHRYLEREILQPLEMDRTTFAQPTPPRIRAQEATGYRFSDGHLVRTDGLSYGHMPPHGPGFRSTASDMARFIGALTDGGGRILGPDSTEEMLQRQFGNAQQAPGMGFGFHEYRHRGERVLVHSGSIPGASAILALVPDRGIGLYASYNGGDRTAAESAWDVVQDFTDRFTEAPPEAPVQETAEHADQYAGTYRSMQVGDTADLGKLAGLAGTVDVTAEPDGTLVTTGAMMLGTAEPQRWKPIAPGLFREQEGSRTIQFGPDGLLATDDPTMPLERLAWYERPTVHLAIAGISLLTLASAALGWPVAGAIRSLRNRPIRGPRWAGLPDG